MGDLRMLFAEDRHKVKKIVEGQFDLFRTMYKPVLEEFASKELLRISHSGQGRESIFQDCGLPAARTLVSHLPSAVKSQMGMKFGEEAKTAASGRIIHEVAVRSRGEAAECLQKVLRR
ncbi:hypothetical protein Ancab_030886 [Ancistrocladus abbreviatus]